MPDDPQPPAPTSPDVVTTVAVISSQIGQLQKTFEIGLNGVERRLDGHERRLTALEEFRIRQEAREEERARWGRERRETSQFTLSRRQAFTAGALGVAMFVLAVLDRMLPT